VASLKYDAASPIGLVLSGGGARGAFQVGVWEILLRDPRGMRALPAVVSGTSAGALNGALIAAGVPPEEMLEFWLDLGRKPPVVANEVFFRSLRSALFRLLGREPGRPLTQRGRELKILGGLLMKHKWSTSGLAAMSLEYALTARFDTLSDLLDSIVTSYLFDTSPMKERIVKALRQRSIKATDVALAINVVDVQTGGVVRIVNRKPKKTQGASDRHYRYEPVITPEMILASASIPLLFNAVRVGKTELWDGGVLVNTPLAPTVALGARRIVPVLVTPRYKGSTGGMETFGDAVERLADSFLENAYSVDRKLLLVRNELAALKGEGDAAGRVVELFRSIRPESSRTFNAGSYLYFEPKAMTEMYEAGKRAAQHWLEHGPLIDSRDQEP
jgi:predicted acylesterase/phospholipase RssA